MQEGDWRLCERCESASDTSTHCVVQGNWPRLITVSVRINAVFAFRYLMSKVASTWIQLLAIFMLGCCDSILPVSSCCSALSPSLTSTLLPACLSVCSSLCAHSYFPPSPPPSVPSSLPLSCVSMATRNLTSKFDSIRSQLHSGTKRPRDYDGGNNALLADSSASDAVESGRGLGLGTEQEMPPEWVDITDSIHADTNKVKESSQPTDTQHSTQPAAVDTGEREREAAHDGRDGCDGGVRA